MKPEIKLQTSNFRGLKGLRNISLNEKITVFAGPGHTGKTSALYALEACVTRDPTPWRVKKSESKISAQRVPFRGEGGTGIAHAMLEVGDDEVSISYPDATVDGSDIALSVNSPRESLADLDQKKRAERLNAMLGTEPTEEQLRKELKEKGIPEKAIDAVCVQVFGSGWDVASKQASSKATELKGAWRQITGETYGSSKAENWSPSTWTPDLEKTEIKTLEAEKVQAWEFFDAAIKSEGADEQRLNDLKRRASFLKANEDQLAQYQTELDENNSESQRVGKKIKGLIEIKELSERSGMKCPECGTELQQNGRQLEKFSKSKPLTKKQADELSALQEKFSELGDLRSDIQNKILSAKAGISEAQKAQEELDSINSDSIGKHDDLDRKKADEDYKNACDRLDAAVAKIEADKKHKMILMNTEIKNVLEPDGLRKKALSKGLKAINEKISQTGVQIRQDMEFVINGFEFEEVSESQKNMMRFVAMAAEADFMGYDLCIIDNTDRLDKTDRGILYKFLLAIMKENKKLRFVLGYMGPKFELPEKIGTVIWFGADDETA